MRVTRRTPWAYALAGFLAGGLLGGTIGVFVASSDDGAILAELKREIAAERRTGDAAEEHVLTLRRELRRSRARLQASTADPMRIAARGFEPLIGLEGVGRMFYRCAGDGMKLALVQDEMSASTEVSYVLPGLPPLSKSLHPGKRIITPAITEASSWTIVQATEPKTVTATVEIGPPAGACYLAPATNATLTSESHDKTFADAD